MISKLTSPISFASRETHNQATGKTRERQTITKSAHQNDDKEEVTPAPRGSAFYHPIDIFESHKVKPKYVDPEHRLQFENPDGWAHDDGPGPIV
jgi:hypothetical protein